MSKPKPTSPPQSRLYDLPFSAFTKSFKPLHDRVALRRHPKSLRPSDGSLVLLPSSKLKNSDRAEVLAVGPGCKLGLKPGQTVVVSRFADGDTHLREGSEGERLMVIPEGEIMAVIEEG